MELWRHQIPMFNESLISCLMRVSTDSVYHPYPNQYLGLLLRPVMRAVYIVASTI